MTRAIIKNIAVFFILQLLTSSLVYSQEYKQKHSILTDKFEFTVGVFYPSKTFDIGVNGTTTNGDIDFGQTFGIETSEFTLFAGFEWRFAKKWKLSTNYFGIQNSGSKVLEKDINWGDYTIKQGTNVYGKIGINVYRIYVGRIFTSGAKHEFGGGLGVHAMNAKAIIEGEMLSSEGDFSFQRSRKSITLPLPNFGLWYYFAPNTNWAFTSNLDVFYLAIGNYSGNLVNLSPGVNYQFFKNISASLNYRFIDIGAKFDSSNWDGDVSFGFNGPSLTINANF
jgi:hypothetical protein